MKNFGTAIILAGGKSTRMGFDKQFLEKDNNRLINTIMSKLKEEFDEIIIVTNKPEEYKDIKARIITDIIKGMGPLGGIHAGLIESTSLYSFILACDMPNIDLQYIRYLKNIIIEKETEICVTKINDYIEPFMGFYSKKVIEGIEKNLSENKRAISSIIKSHNTYYIEDNIDKDIFLNLNTQEDLKKWEKGEGLKSNE